MKHKFVRLLSVLAVIIFISAGAVCTAYAAESPNGSILLTLICSENPEQIARPVIGAQISIYRVADAVLAESGNFAFSLTPDFAASNLDLSDPNADGLVSGLREYIAEHCCAALDTKSTSCHGIVEFLNLDSGLYFLQMTKQDPEFHFMKEFVVSLPMKDQKGALTYHVDATPKIEIVRGTTDLTVIKRWQNDLEAQRPPSITVELLGNGLLADTAVLNSENNWTYTFQNLPLETNWTVQEKEIPNGYICSIGCPLIEHGRTTIIITNTQKSSLPPLIQTGQLRWPIPLLILSGLCLLTCRHFLLCAPHSIGRRNASLLRLVGFALLSAGLCLYTANQLVSRSAGRACSDLVSNMQQTLVQNAHANSESSLLPLHVNPYDQKAAAPSLKMPAESIQGFECIGLLEIPALKLQLPILSDWSYQKLKTAPCRHMGSVKSDDLVIAGHNYRAHFGRLDRLNIGDIIRFVDMEGTLHCYTVSTLQVIDPTDLDAVLDDTLDLVLYTCTYSGKNRLMVGCQCTEKTPCE